MPTRVDQRGTKPGLYYTVKVRKTVEKLAFVGVCAESPEEAARLAMEDESIPMTWGESGKETKARVVDVSVAQRQPR